MIFDKSIMGSILRNIFSKNIYQKFSNGLKSLKRSDGLIYSLTERRSSTLVYLADTVMTKAIESRNSEVLWKEPFN